MKQFTLVFVTLFAFGCATTSRTEKSETHTVTTTIDTIVTVDIPRVVDTTVTVEEKVVHDDGSAWIQWASTAKAPDGKPKFTAKRNVATGETIVDQKVDSQQVGVKGTTTTTDEKKQTSSESKSWLSEARSLIIWIIIGVVVVAFLVVYLKTRVLK